MIDLANTFDETTQNPSLKGKEFRANAVSILEAIGAAWNAHFTETLPIVGSQRTIENLCKIGDNLGYIRQEQSDGGASFTIAKPVGDFGRYTHETFGIQPTEMNGICLSKRIGEAGYESSKDNDVRQAAYALTQWLAQKAAGAAPAVQQKLKAFVVDVQAIIDPQPPLQLPRFLPRPSDPAA